MTNHDNQTTPQIYYRPLRKWIEVTLEEKQNWERFINATRKAKQRAGTCCIPYKKSYKCDGLCEECEYRCISKDAPQYLSIDGEMEITQKNGTRNSFLAHDVMTTEISIDSMILNRLLAELRDTDPESYQILPHHGLLSLKRLWPFETFAFPASVLVSGKQLLKGA